MIRVSEIVYNPSLLIPSSSNFFEIFADTSDSSGTPENFRIVLVSHAESHGIADELEIGDLSGKRVLIVHQNFAALELKKRILKEYPDAEVATGSFFNAVSKDADFKFNSEEDFRKLFETNTFDVVYADRAFERIVHNIYKGSWVDFPHFAVSGKLLEEL